MIELLGNPAAYDGKRVTVDGYAHLGFEDNGIYLHKDDFDYGLRRNGLWITLAEGVDSSQCQDAYVHAEGTFKAGLGGHMGLWSGTLDRVTKCTKQGKRRG
jgi:hypothetical protein